MGLIFFSLYIYMLTLGHVMTRHNILFNLYADDTSLYLPVNPIQSDIDGLMDLQGLQIRL